MRLHLTALMTCLEADILPRRVTSFAELISTVVQLNNLEVVLHGTNLRGAELTEVVRKSNQSDIVLLINEGARLELLTSFRVLERSDLHLTSFISKCQEAPRLLNSLIHASTVICFHALATIPSVLLCIMRHN